MQNKIREICSAKYGISVEDAVLLQDGSDNLVYLFYSNDVKYVLRISKKQKDDEDFLFETTLIKHLYENGIPVPKPIYNNENSFLTKYDEQKMILFSFCDGEKIIFDKNNLPKEQQAYNAGVILAKIHNLTESYTSSYQTSRTMLSELNRIIEHQKEFTHKYEDGAIFVTQVYDIIASLNNCVQQNCIIHNDFRTHNLLFNQNEISAVLDFDWSCYGNPLKDLAHTMVEWSYPDGSSQPDVGIMNKILQGYESIRGISDKSELKYWMCFSCLSDAATYFMDRLNPISEKKQLRSYMYKKFLYFSTQDIAQLSAK